MAKNKSWKLLANILTPSLSFSFLSSPPLLLFSALLPPFFSVSLPFYVNVSGANTCSQARWGATMRVSRILWQMFSNRIKFVFAVSSSFSFLSHCMQMSWTPAHENFFPAYIVAGIDRRVVVVVDDWLLQRSVEWRWSLDVFAAHLLRCIAAQTTPFSWGCV